MRTPRGIHAKVRTSEDGGRYLDLSIKLADEPRVNAKGTKVYFATRYTELPVEVGGDDLDLICTVMTPRAA